MPSPTKARVLPYLVAREQLADDLGDAELFGGGVRGCFAVTGEHDDALHAALAQILHGGGRAGLGTVGDLDAAEIAPLARDVHERARAEDALGLQAERLHEPLIADGNTLAAHNRNDALARSLSSVRGGVLRGDRPGGGLDALAHRVIGKALRRGGDAQQFLRGDLRLRVHLNHLEHAARERAGLVKHDTVGLREQLEIAAALDEDAAAACAADAGEE